MQMLGLLFKEKGWQIGMLGKHAWNALVQALPTYKMWDF